MSDSSSQTLIERLASHDVRWWAVAISCLYSVIVVVGNPLPNDDAFGYLLAAEIFSEQGLNATLSSYGWYGYSVLIALFDAVMPTDLLMSAHLLNMFFLALLVYAFITLASEINDSQHIQFFAALVILCFPTINEMRYNLVRDFAYWAFVLTALNQLIRFHRTRNILHATGWMLAMTAAIFFRLEGLLILVLSPLAMLFSGESETFDGRASFLKLVAFMLVGVFLILSMFYLAGINLVEIFNFAYRWYLPLLGEYPATLRDAADSVKLSTHISTQLLPFTGKGLLILFVGYVYAVIVNLVMALGPAVAFFMVYGFFIYRPNIKKGMLAPWLFFLASALLALMLFVSIMQFLTSRYAVMTALLLLLFLPSLLETLFKKAQRENKQKRFSVTVTVVALYFTLDSLISFGYSKSYIQDAISWSDTALREEPGIITNSPAAAYFLGLTTYNEEIENDPAVFLETLPSSTVMILELPHDASRAHDMLSARNYITELARFANNRNDAMVIYRVGDQP